MRLTALDGPGRGPPARARCEGRRGPRRATRPLPRWPGASFSPRTGSDAWRTGPGRAPRLSKGWGRAPPSSLVGIRANLAAKRIVPAPTLGAFPRDGAYWCASLEAARIGSLHFILPYTPSDQMGSSFPIGPFAPRLSAQALSRGDLWRGLHEQAYMVG